MPNPVARVVFAVERGALNVDALVLGIEIDVADRGRLVRDGVCDAEGCEEGRVDEVEVLSWVGEETHHAEDGEAGHCA